jgi:hypothetical protein
MDILADKIESTADTERLTTFSQPSFTLGYRLVGFGQDCC